MCSFRNPVASSTVENVIRYSISVLSPRRIILFGSRARGDSDCYSDYDLAFEIPEADSEAWVRFVLDVEEMPLTLQHVDLVNLNTVSEELRRRIHEDGIVIYDSSKS